MSWILLVGIGSLALWIFTYGDILSKINDRMEVIRLRGGTEAIIRESRRRVPVPESEVVL